MSELKGKILAGNILIESIQDVEKTTSGIIIPVTTDKKSFKGKVLLIGNPKHGAPMEVQVGDTVVYNKKYMIEELIIDQTDYIIMSQECVLYIE